MKEGNLQNRTQHLKSFTHQDDGGQASNQEATSQKIDSVGDMTTCFQTHIAPNSRQSIPQTPQLCSCTYLPLHPAQTAFRVVQIVYMEVSQNWEPRKSSNSNHFSISNQPLFGVPHFKKASYFIQATVMSSKSNSGLLRGMVANSDRSRHQAAMPVARTASHETKTT